MKRTILAAALVCLVSICAAREAHAAISVESVLRDGPAEAAGLQAGDQIVRLDGHAIANMDDLRKVTAAHEPGDTVPITVLREGQETGLSLTFGQRPEGGASIGVMLAVSIDPSAGPTQGTVECLGWIDKTYRVDSMMKEMNLDLAEAYQAILACVQHDTQRMTEANAIKYCDNVFKVHCSAVDVLTEIGEAQVDRCEKLIEDSLGLKLRQYDSWRTCGQNKVYDRAGTGETIWEHRYEHAPAGSTQRGYGVGPRSTPLIDGELLFTIGVAGEMRALKKNDGEFVWSHTLWDGEFEGNHLSHGYSSSPVAYRDSVIVTVGDENASLVAFDQQTGSVKWKGLNFRNSFSSPRIVEIVGEQQLVVFMAGELIGVDPDNGQLRWRYPHANQWGHNITMPEVVGGDTIFLSSPQIGARGLKLTRNGGKIEVEEIWSSRRVQFYHGSSVLIGDWVYGSSGMATPAFMTAVNIRTGELGWRERGIARANCVEVDGKLVILDEDGMLYLASATPKELVVHARTQLLDELAWTVPTIVGTTLYVRNNEQIVAVDLGPGEPDSATKPRSR